MNVISEFIKEKGSQEKAANFLGVTQTAVWKWVRGLSKPRLKYARIIAREMNVALEDVYGGKDE